MNKSLSDCMECIGNWWDFRYIWKMLSQNYHPMAGFILSLLLKHNAFWFSIFNSRRKKNKKIVFFDRINWNWKSMEFHAVFWHFITNILTIDANGLCLKQKFNHVRPVNQSWSKPNSCTLTIQVAPTSFDSVRCNLDSSAPLAIKSECVLKGMNITMSDGVYGCLFLLFLCVCCFVNRRDCNCNCMSAMVFFEERVWNCSKCSSKKLDMDGYCNIDASWTTISDNILSFNINNGRSVVTTNRNGCEQTVCVWLTLHALISLSFSLSLCLYVCECLSLKVYVCAKERDTTDHTPLSLFDICFVAWSYVTITRASYISTQMKCYGICGCIKSIVHFKS